jgi:hypothetical protein
MNRIPLSKREVLLIRIAARESYAHAKTYADLGEEMFIDTFEQHVKFILGEIGAYTRENYLLVLGDN